FRPGLWENLAQRAAVSYLRHAQGPGRELPLAARQPNRGHEPRGRAARAVRMGRLSRFVRLFVRVFLEPRVHRESILGPRVRRYPRRGSNPRWTGFKPAASAIGLRG